MGVPKHEKKLVDAAQKYVSHILRPGPGRSVFLLLEPEVYAGRPDLLFIVASTRGIDAFRRAGLRLPSPVAAQALDEGLGSKSLGISSSYASSLRRSLSRQGWTHERARAAARLVSDSLVIEAKMKDWKRALEQAAKLKPTAHRTAILMPQAAAVNVATKSLELYDVGLIALDDRRPIWLRDGGTAAPNLGRRLWLLELLLRAGQS